MASPSSVLHDLAPATSRLHGDEGTALVEAAFVTLPLLTLLLAILDYGLLFRAYLTMENASTVGARSVSIDPLNPLADFKAIQSTQRAALALSTQGVSKIVVYKATGGTDSISNHAGCLTASATNSCNRYVATDIADNVSAHFDCTPGAPFAATSPSRFWCPVPAPPATGRVATNSSANYAGFYIEYSYSFVSKLFGTTKLLTADTVIRLEPQSN